MENEFNLNNEPLKYINNKPNTTIKSIIYSTYTKLIQFEHHFDLITNKFKYMALYWILGTYAAIGFVLSKEAETITFNPIFAVIASCFIGMVIITLIWNQDINIYTKFWAVMFIEEIRMEARFKFLSKSRTLEMLLDDDRERIVSQGHLYIIANLLFLSTIYIATTFLMSKEPLLHHIALLATFVLIGYLISSLMKKSAKNTHATFINAIKLIKKENKS